MRRQLLIFGIFLGLGGAALRRFRMLTTGCLWSVKLLRAKVTVIELMQFHEHFGAATDAVAE
jgi:hypothetical protein